MSIIERPTSADLRASLLEAGDRLRDLRSKPEGDRSEKHDADLREATRVVNALDAEFEATRQAEAHEVQQAVWDAAVARGGDNEGRGPSAAFGDTGGPDDLSLAGRVLADPKYTEWRGNTGDRFPSMEFRGSLHESRALIDGTLTGTGNAGVLKPVAQPVPPVPRQQTMFVRDLIPTYQTTFSSVPYVREYTPATFEVGASSVAEGVAKPEATMQWETVTCIIEKLAVWVPVTTEILADAPLLRGYIENRLTYMIKFREQAEILKGNGISPDLVGVYTVSGTQTQAATNNDVPGTIADSIALIENVDGVADGIVMNPGDFWAQISERRSTTFDGEAFGTAPFGAPPPTLWGLPVVRTRALSTLECVVGDWAQGAGIFDRMSVSLRQSDSHSDYFTLNKVVLLAEERLGAAWFRPDLFVKTTLDITA